MMHGLNINYAALHTSVHILTLIHVTTIQKLLGRVFEGFSTTFKASTNVYFTYFCHIFTVSDNTCTKITSKMLSSNTNKSC